MGKPKPSKKKKKRVRPDGEDSKKEKKTSYSIEDILNKAEECLDEYNFDLAKVMLIERERRERRERGLLLPSIGSDATFFSFYQSLILLKRCKYIYSTTFLPDFIQV